MVWHFQSLPDTMGHYFSEENRKKTLTNTSFCIDYETIGTLQTKKQSGEDVSWDEYMRHSQTHADTGIHLKK